MIPSTDLYFGAAVVYGVLFVAFVAWLRRLEGDGRRLCALATGLVGLSAVAYTMMSTGAGMIPVAGGVVDAPNLLDDTATYAGMYGLAAVLAGPSKRWIVAVSGIVAAQRLAFELPYAGIVGGTGALAAAGVVVVGWFVISGIFAGPIWRAARNQPAKRRLVHWKCRNLVLFLFATLIVYAMLALSGVLTEFLNTSLNLYIDLLMRVGVTSLLFVNAGSLGEDDGRGSTSSVVSPAPASATGE
ncbi:bacteriorhodopsin [Halobium salinum]|uniref:Bacteriorhodopsin n=1 Tax=Halobium salinum TaxID=1364940 RepID=A0ABD5PIP8_9EURY|nr:bacteriorhodopsin [Halobium salinum]